ncbi:hypothetical protein KAR91_26850 [Candidatus Pacearchaeota archaeon]|nr:hypothetical protein [Candidatus Pacearchaeota archaeon]
MKYNKLFEFDPLKSFVSLPALWFVVGLLFTLAAVLAFIIADHSEIAWVLDYKGFNNVFTIFKWPLTLLALIIPIVALLAANHRSEQTKAQILSTNEQNVFANYYKHIEEFEKYLSSHITNTNSKITNTRNTHRALFKDADKGDFLLSPNIRESIELAGRELVILFKYFYGGHKGTESDTIVEIELTIRNIEKLIGISWSISGKSFRHNNLEIPIPNGTLSGFLYSILQRLQTIYTAVSFDQDYVAPESIQQVLASNRSNIPSHNLINSEINAQSFKLL